MGFSYSPEIWESFNSHNTKFKKLEFEDMGHFLFLSYISEDLYIKKNRKDLDRQTLSLWICIMKLMTGGVYANDEM